VAIVLCVKELTEYLYQQEAGFCLRSLDLQDSGLELRTSNTPQVESKRSYSYNGLLETRLYNCLIDREAYDDNYVLMAMTDKGMGIMPEHLEHI
jgi:hypothetical protein